MNYGIMKLRGAQRLFCWGDTKGLRASAGLLNALGVAYLQTQK